MERSEEICRVVERWLSAESVGDRDAAVARVSEHPATVLIGTDPNEWWQGDEALRVFGRQLEESGGFKLAPG